MNSFLKRFILRQENTFFKTARRYFFPGGVVYVMKKDDFGDASSDSTPQKSTKTFLIWYFTVLVSKKTAPKATQRNLFKRIGKEAIREAIQSIQENREKNSTNQQTTIQLVLLLKNKPNHEFTVKELQKILKSI